MRLPVLLFAVAQLSAAAQHLHIQTAYSPTAGWSLFWYDFDAGPFAANDFTQPVVSAARTTVPLDPVLTNALGRAGSPVWILPQVEQPRLPSVGFGTQGSGAFQNGRIRLRLVAFSGPGNFAIYNTAPFGGYSVTICTRDGLSEADTVIQSFPAGHAHVNWAFTRPGLYELGLQASGIDSSDKSLQSEVVTFRFRVQEPRLRLRLYHSGNFELNVQAGAGLPVEVETSDDLINWQPLFSTQSSHPEWKLPLEKNRPLQFFRARVSF